MIRLLRIARREYVAYVRTFGFWMSICLMPVGLIAAMAAPALIARHTPPATLAIVDLTGRDLVAKMGPAFKASPTGDSPGVILVQPPAPVGGDLEFADDLTLGRAIDGRRVLSD